MSTRSKTAATETTGEHRTDNANRVHTILQSLTERSGNNFSIDDLDTSEDWNRSTRSFLCIFVTDTLETIVKHIVVPDRQTELPGRVMRLGNSFCASKCTVTTAHLLLCSSQDQHETSLWNTSMEHTATVWKKRDGFIVRGFISTGRRSLIPLSLTKSHPSRHGGRETSSQKCQVQAQFHSWAMSTRYDDLEQGRHKGKMASKRSNSKENAFVDTNTNKKVGTSLPFLTLAFVFLLFRRHQARRSYWDRWKVVTLTLTFN